MFIILQIAAAVAGNAKSSIAFFPSLIEAAVELAKTTQPFSAVNGPEAKDQCKKAKR